MTEREQDFSEAILGLGVVVSVAVESLDAYRRSDMADRLLEAVERFADENPEFRPAAVEIVRRTVEAMLES
ncbi:MAG: hypothetical protein OXC00_08420 [Acidimicrobiaceae bacterium]|nr:hypothetical protein [Acidimicrobiaceae bacterium]